MDREREMQFGNEGAWVHPCLSAPYLTSIISCIIMIVLLYSLHYINHYDNNDNNDASMLVRTLHPTDDVDELRVVASRLVKTTTFIEIMHVSNVRHRSLSDRQSFMFDT